MILITLSKKDMQRGIKIPPLRNHLLAELCGIHIADGHLGFRKNKGEYLIQCTGNLIDDRAYYDNHLRFLWESLFGLKVNFRERTIDNTYELRVYSKSIAVFFNEVLELPFGKKSHSITIPKWIKETSKDKISKEMKACIRGIVDNDFYFVLDRGSPELGAWFASKDLVLDLWKYFKLLGLEPRTRLDVKYYNKSSQKDLIRHQLRIRRIEDIKLWFSEVGTNNPKIYKRYQEFMYLCPGGVDDKLS